MAEPHPPPITFISIELCQECSKHKWCTRHDEKKYNDLFEEVKKEVQLLYPNVQVLKNPEIKKPQIGAFEVKINDSTIFSKIKSGLFPVPAALAQRIKLFFEDYEAARDISKYSSIREKKYSPPKKKNTQTALDWNTKYEELKKTQTPKKKQEEVNNGEDEGTNEGYKSENKNENEVTPVKEEKVEKHEEKKNAENEKNAHVEHNQGEKHEVKQEEARNENHENPQKEENQDGKAE